ncbi:lysozyme inhibitor LprI family protein [Ancylobacter terrae]|uniref:lysozyme inhibitor LprI family protein n=1 Tax=Ancylobacter sp. sgz301288 TaxID=3342077 RepID=UPI00385DAC11
MRRVVTLAALAGCLTLPANAASFDCAAAKAPDEIAVCGNARLSELDSEMGALWFAYRAIPMMMGANGARQDEARAFLQDRATCGGNGACLTKLYAARIAALKSGITAAVATCGPATP